MFSLSNSGTLRPARGKFCQRFRLIYNFLDDNSTAYVTESAAMYSAMLSKVLNSTPGPGTYFGEPFAETGFGFFLGQSAIGSRASSNPRRTLSRT